MEPIETASRDEIAALQFTRLKQSLAHAYANVPHYKTKFDAAGAHPSELKSLADLAKFPFTTKQDLRENYPFGMFAVPREKVVRVHASSGSCRRRISGYSVRLSSTPRTTMAPFATTFLRWTRTRNRTLGPNGQHPNEQTPGHALR